MASARISSPSTTAASSTAQTVLFCTAFFCFLGFALPLFPAGCFFFPVLFAAGRSVTFTVQRGADEAELGMVPATPAEVGSVVDL